MVKGIYYDWMREKMLQYKLIEKSGALYVLTERGWLFETFASEERQYRRERFLKNHAYWRAKLWLLLIALGYIAGLLTPMLSDKVKTALQSQEVKMQPKQPVK